MMPTLHSGKLRSMASVYLMRNDQLLLLFRQGKSIVSNLWIGSAGGHFDKNEVSSAKACLLRELWEELSISEESISNLSLRYVTLRYTDGEIRQNYYFFADLTDPHIDTPQSTEGITQWFSFHELSTLPMPVTARHIIDHYIHTGRFDNKLYGGLSTQSNIVMIAL